MNQLKSLVFIFLLVPTICFAEENLYDQDFFSFDLSDTINAQPSGRTGKFSVLDPFSSVKGEKGGLFVELGGRYDPNIAVARIGVFRTYGGWYSIMIGGEALSDDDDHTYGGATVGFRMKFPLVITPFIGLHFFGGTYEEEEDAANDGIDNDEDGTVDEANETKWVTEDTMVATCPEAGLMIYMDKNSQFVISAKYYVTDKGRDSDFWVYTVGINIVF
ncbi:MAG: hypothetical protein GY714_01405 [Desulfobacterales bacterium]|nr:hypothetical protein [Desulfobacterales bacterium]MCP4159182.1 hypothetical protein [Deltaproteobacteria bacterium]